MRSLKASVWYTSLCRKLPYDPCLGRWKLKVNRKLKRIHLNSWKLRKVLIWFYTTVDIWRMSMSIQLDVQELNRNSYELFTSWTGTFVWRSQNFPCYYNTIIYKMSLCASTRFYTHSFEIWFFQAITKLKGHVFCNTFSKQLGFKIQNKTN